MFDDFIKAETTDEEKWQIIEEHDLLESQGFIGDCMMRKFAQRFTEKYPTDDVWIMDRLYITCLKYFALKHKESLNKQERPCSSVEAWKPTPQTEEQVAEGLREAFRVAVKERIVTPQSDNEIVKEDAIRPEVIQKAMDEYFMDEYSDEFAKLAKL
jgi:hypothetical protein